MAGREGKDARGTPTPLRRLADPIAWQVMPSRRSSRVRRRPTTGGTHASSMSSWSGSVASGVSSASRARGRKRKREQKRVLDEDDYEAAMTHIIRRDFFPDNRRMENHLAWDAAVKSGDVGQMAAVRRRLMSDLRRATTPHTGGSVAGGATPRMVTPALGLEAAEAEAGANDELPDADLTLDRFLAVNTSEDNASFRRNMQKKEKKEREAHWWVYESTTSASGRAKHLALTAPQEPKLLKDILDAGPDQRGMLATWKHRGQNQLHWTPELAVSEDTCGVTAEGKRLAIKNRVAAGDDEDDIVARRAPKAISHASTRLRSKFDPQQRAALARAAKRQAEDAELNSATAIAAAAAAAPTGGRINKRGVAVRPGQQKEGGGGGGGGDKGVATGRVKGYAFVATPRIEPGVGPAASPLVTWGDIDGTPLALEPLDTPVDATPGRQYTMPKASKREAIAQALDRRARKKRRARAQAFATPLRPRTATPGSRGRRPLSSAAAGLARRLASSTPSIFGASSLRASYSGATPRRRPSTRRRSGRARTPKSTAGAGASSTKRLTAGLLDGL